MITDAMEEYPYDLLIFVPPHKGAQVVIDSGIAPEVGLGSDRPSHPPGQADGRAGPEDEDARAIRTSTRSGTRRTSRSRRPGRPPTSRRRSSPSASPPPSWVAPRGKHANYTGKVMCFFEVGDGKGTLLQFDYDHPPKPPKPNQLWHLGKVLFNKTYWQTVPRAGSPRRPGRAIPRRPGPVRRAVPTRAGPARRPCRRPGDSGGPPRPLGRARLLETKRAHERRLAGRPRCPRSKRGRDGLRGPIGHRPKSRLSPPPAAAQRTQPARTSQ